MSSRISMNVTGLDTETIIQELMKLERRPLAVLESKKDLVANKKTAWNGIKSKLESIISKMKPLLERSIFEAKGAKVRDPGIMSATVSEAAVPGDYDIEVVALARPHVIQSDPFTQAPDAALEVSGTISMSLEGLETEPFLLEITQSDSLNSIAARINAFEGAGVKASVLEVHPSEYSLVLTAELTGKQIMFDAENCLGLATVSGCEPAQAAFKLNGITFTRNSNSVSDAIPGVSFDLLRVGQTSFTIDYDNDAVVKTVKEFIDEYNSLLDMTGKYNSWDPDTKKSGLLFGDPLLQRLLFQIRQAIFSEIAHELPGFRFVGQIGISTGSLGSFSRDGRLSLDEAKLRGALSTDRNAVASLLSEDQAGPEGILVNLRKTMEMYTAYGGFLPVKDAQLASQDKDISRQIQNLERRLELRLANLKRQFTALEVLLTKMDSQRLWLAQQIQGLYGN
ncbi:MAG: flagellar filament capping protein FliD [Bacillota bacterium]